MALLTVGIGDCRISNDPADVIVTHALGSCIAIVIYDPVARVAGLLHYMLPDSAIDPDKAAKRPFMFADTGIPLLIDGTLRLGATKSRSVVMAAGGGQMLDYGATLNIGRRNHVAMREAFWKAGVIAYSEEIGGTLSRTLKIDVAFGRVHLMVSGRAELDVNTNSNKTRSLSRPMHAVLASDRKYT